MVSETEDLELKEQVKVDRVALQRLKKQDEFRTSLDTREGGEGAVWQGAGWRGGWGVGEYKYNKCNQKAESGRRGGKTHSHTKSSGTSKF